MYAGIQLTWYGKIRSARFRLSTSCYDFKYSQHLIFAAEPVLVPPSKGSASLDTAKAPAATKEKRREGEGRDGSASAAVFNNGHGRGKRETPS